MKSRSIRSANLDLDKRFDKRKIRGQGSCASADAFRFSKHDTAFHSHVRLIYDDLPNVLRSFHYQGKVWAGLGPGLRLGLPCCDDLTSALQLCTMSTGKA